MGVFGQQATPESNNSSDVLHENPDEADDENEYDRLLSYLSGRMNSRIGESTLHLTNGQYDAAKEALGDDYSESLAKYVDVEGETGEEGAGDQYETIRQTQREYVETVQQFDQTRREYREAKQSGDDERARELARELTRLADEGKEQSSQLGVAYEALGNETGSDLSESTEQVESVQTRLDEQTAEIVTAEFTATRLVVRSHSTNVSFTDPLVVSGTLETENGTPVEAETASFSIGAQTIRTPVQSNGSFTLTYRPTRVRANVSNLTLQYRPANSSVYQASEQTLDVSITPVTATARVSVPTESTYGYADELPVTARLLVEGTPVEQYPLTASLAGETVSAGATDENGRMTLNGTVPASTAVGDATVRVAPPHRNLAVQVAPVTETISITSEQTQLDATARMTDERTVLVEGTLETRDGEAVSDQPVELSLGGQPVASATTGPSGAYQTTVELPSDLNAENATLTVAFDGDGTNLESSSTAVDIGQHGSNTAATGSSEGELPFTVTNLLWAVAGAGLFGLAAVVLMRRRTGGDSSDEEETDGAVSADVGASDPTSSPSLPATAALASATESISAGRPNDAVVVAYTAVRHALTPLASVDDSATHWEFYDRCVAAGVADADTLESLTREYEKAAFSGLSVSVDAAEAFVETARTLVTTHSES